MSVEICPTVKVVAENEQGFIIINEEDFNAAEHKLFGEVAAQVKAVKEPKGFTPA
jgi:hypothetical protein